MDLKTATDYAAEKQIAVTKEWCRGWDAARAALASSAASQGEPAAEWRKAVMEAYGHLWHVNNEPMAPIPLRSPEKAAYEARKCLRELLTTAERGEAINAVGALLERSTPSASERQQGGEASAVEEECKALIADGRTIAAIKHYRSASGCSLIEAKWFIDRLIPHILDRSAPAATRAGEAKLPLTITSAPGCIWLDLGFNPLEEDAHFSNLADVTWSEDNATGDGIKYVRADLAAQPPHAPPAAPSAEQGEITEAQIETIASHHVRDVGWYEFERNDFIACVRAILATQPAAPVVLTDEDIARIAYETVREMPKGSGPTWYDKAFARNILLAAAPKTGGANG